MLMMSSAVIVCVGRCGSTWGAALADHGVTVCEVLMESPGWLVVCCSWCVCVCVCDYSQASPSGHPDSGVSLLAS